MSGKKSRYEYEYDENDLLTKVLEYSDGSLKSIEEQQFFKEGFEKQLKELGFDYSNAVHASKIQAQNTYYLKNLASFPNGEEKHLPNFCGRRLITLKKQRKPEFMEL